MQYTTNEFCSIQEIFLQHFSTSIDSRREKCPEICPTKNSNVSQTDTGSKGCLLCRSRRICRYIAEHFVIHYSMLYVCKIRVVSVVVRNCPGSSKLHVHVHVRYVYSTCILKPKGPWIHVFLYFSMIHVRLTFSLL